MLIQKAFLIPIGRNGRAYVSLCSKMNKFRWRVLMVIEEEGGQRLNVERR